MTENEYWSSDLQDTLQFITDHQDGLPVVACYLRVSSDIQVDEGFSIEMQAEHCRRECDSRYPGGYHIIFVTDEGLSGALPAYRPGMGVGDFRPGFSDLCQLVQMGVVQAVGVYRCNRLTRRLRIWLEFLEDQLTSTETLFFSVSEGLDTSSPSANLMFSILMSEAELERDQIATGVADGIRQRRNEGYKVGVPGYGWAWQDYRAVPNGRRIDVEPVAHEAEIVRQIFHWYLDGRSYRWIARTLTEQRVPTARGCSTWRKGIVRGILKCPTHAGLIRTDYGELRPGMHYEARIIDPETFHQVQDEIRRRQDASADDNRPTGLLFAHLLRCHICGARMGVRSPSKYGPSYDCAGNIPGRQHPAFRLNLEVVEKRLERVILQAASDSRLITKAVAALESEMQDRQSSLERSLASLNRRLRRNEDSVCLWASRLGDEQHDQAEVEAELQIVVQERKSMESAVANTKKAMRREKRMKKTTAAAIELVRTLPKLWRRMNGDEKRDIVSQVMQSLTCEPNSGGVTIHADVIPVGVQDIRFYVQRKVPPSSGDPFAIGPGLLTTAYFFRQGLSNRQVAGQRGVSLDVVEFQKSQLKQRTGTATIDEAISVLSPVIDARKEELYIDGRRSPKSGGEKTAWTSRQIEFLRLRTSGLTVTQVADQMGLRAKGARSMQARVYRKLGAHSVAEAVAAAQSLGLIAPDEVDSMLQTGSDDAPVQLPQTA